MHQPCARPFSREKRRPLSGTEAGVSSARYFKRRLVDASSSTTGNPLFVCEATGRGGAGICRRSPDRNAIPPTESGIEDKHAPILGLQALSIRKERHADDRYDQGQDQITGRRFPALSRDEPE